MGRIRDTTFSVGKAIYPFEIYTADTEFNNVGAVYFFTRRNDNSGGHSLLYIGQSGELGVSVSHRESREVGLRQRARMQLHLRSSRGERTDPPSHRRGIHSGMPTPCNDE